MKCEICKKTIEETFLSKIKGTYVRIDGKKKVICQKCQSEGRLKELYEE